MFSLPNSNDYSPTLTADIVESCGGFYVEDQDDKSADRKVVISCAEDRKSWPAWKRRGVLLVDKEAVLSGVLSQTFEPDKFKLLD